MTTELPTISKTMRPLKVCHISTVHPLHDPRIFYLECWGQVKSGHQVTYVVQSDKDDYIINGVHIRSIGKSSRLSKGVNARRRFTRFANAVRLTPKLNAEIYHIHDPELIPLGIWLRLVTRTIVIFDAHEDDVAYIRQKTYINPVLRAVLTLYMMILVRIAARIMHAIVVCDRGVADLYGKQYGARNVVIAHNFPRLDVFTITGDSQVEVVYDLAYHGSIPRYHLETAFSVAEALRQRGVMVRWLFFGNCPDINWASSELKKRGLREYFDIQNQWIHYEDVVPRIRQARLGFIPLPDMPKFHNNIPSKLFEFMALKMPTILSDLPPSRPFVGDGECAIMVPPGDYEAYADAIIKLLNDPDLRSRMGKIARKRVEQEYNWENEAKVIEQLYQALTLSNNA